MLGNNNFMDGMHINYDNNYVNPMYNTPLMQGMPAPAPGYMPMAGGCPYMTSNNINAGYGVQHVCPFMNAGMQYSPVMPPVNQYNGYSNLSSGNYAQPLNQPVNFPANLNMVSMRPVSIQEIQD